MHYTKQKPIYEKIRNIPVLALLQMSNRTLYKLECRIKNESERATLALKWIRGIRRIKDAKGGKNGK